jgi:mannosyltransferase
VSVRGLTLFGVALGTQAHMFAARYTIAATPFVALGVAFGLAVLGARSVRLAAVGILLVGAITVWPTMNGRVYAKDLERSGAFDPTADARALQALGSRSEDVAIFNVLSLAGAYDVYRRPNDPGWSYAQRWDPVTEPMERVTERLSASAVRHARLWTVLYQGTVGPNAEVKAWLDRHLFPAGATWRDETLVTLHLALVEPRTEVDLSVMWANGVALTEAAYTTETQPGGGVTIDLKWQARQPIERDYVVFVHLYDAAGRLVAQHDGRPAGGSRPTAEWTPGRGVPDPHGLMAPLDALGVMTLRVGLYDSQSGQRLPLASGGESAEIGYVRVAAR